MKQKQIIFVDNQQYDDENVTDFQLKNLQRIINENKRRNEKIIRNDRIRKYNKFVTNLTNIQQEEKKDDNDNNNNNTLEYSFGFPFKYDPKYHQHDYWLIIPKYNDLKQEILSNKLSTITISQYNYDYNKAKYFLTCNYFKQLLSLHLDRESMKIDHVLSLMFYTNYTRMSSVFSSTFRKILNDNNNNNNIESNEELKSRNSEYYNWSKSLFESVHHFCERSHSLPDDGVYHGVNHEMLFSTSYGMFNGPLSTTTNKQTALDFADNHGLLLRLNKYDTYYVYFNCKFVSDFSGENELLFFQQKLGIESVTLVRLKENYKWYNKAIQILSMILKCEEQVMSDRIDENFKDKTKLLHYFNSMIDGDNNKFPVYTNALFMNVANKINKITFNIWLWKQKRYDREEPYYGYNSLQTLFMETKKNDKCNFVDIIKLCKLCKNCKEIDIYNVNHRFEMFESTLLNDEFLKYLLNIKLSSISNITIFRPNEEIMSINDFIKKYNDNKNNKSCLNLKYLKKQHPTYHTKEVETLYIFNSNRIDLFECIESNEYEQFVKSVNNLSSTVINKKRHNDGLNLLLYAAQFNAFKFMQYLLINYKDSIDINCTNNAGNHALIICKDYECIKLLIESGIDINLQSNRFKQGALHYACYQQKIDIVQLLINGGADVNIQNYEGNTPLHCTAKENNIEIIEVLINNKANANILNDKKESALYFACNPYLNDDIVNLLINKGEYCFSNWMNAKNALYIASVSGNIKLVQNVLSIKSNIDINKKTKFPEDTALNALCSLYAATKNENYLEIIKLLIKYQKGTEWIDIDAKCGKTLIWYAAIMKDDDKLWNLLIKHKPNFNVRPTKNTMNGVRLNDSVFDMKILRNWDMKHEWTTPLTVSCHFGNEKVIKYLLQNNIFNVEIISEYNYNLNAFQLCALHGNNEILQMLFEYICKSKKYNKHNISQIVNMKDCISGLTAFHLSCKYSHLLTVKYLVTNVKVDINIKSNANKTGLDYAKEYQYHDIIAFLTIIINSRRDNAHIL